jgi:hypothetical protein
MNDEKVMTVCDLCGNQFQMGPHRYDGKWINRYQLSVCRSCYNGNWDGWGPFAEEKLIPHLKMKGIAIPERNDKGCIPRD